MERIRLNRRDALLLAVCGLVIIAGVAVGLLYFDDAFPEATVDFQIGRGESEVLARSMLEQLGLEVPENYRHASRFSYGGRAKIYLEKEVGLEQMEALIGDPVLLWNWAHRWYLPGSKEEYVVRYTPAGDFMSFEHQVQEDAPGDSLGRDSAIAAAERFLVQTAGVDTSELVFHGATRARRPNRIDWWVTWKHAGLQLPEGGDYRYRIGLHGGEVGSYRQYVHVPEEWRSSYNRLRSRNQLAGAIATLFLVVTVIALVVVFVLKLRRQDIRWKTALIFGAVATVLVYINQLNDLPNTLYGYDTTTSWSGFLLKELLLGLLQALGVGVLIALITAGAEAMFRERYPALPSLPRMFTARGLRTKSAFINIVVGITMTAFFFAYQVLFYMAAHRLGGWSPADVPYSNLLNTAFPFVAVLLMGFLPAVSEEFISRMFSIPFLQKLFRGRATWLAVLIPAVIWGFGHAGYPNQPFWIRGVEVGVAGVIVGIIMLRFGILAPLVWHYTVDAIYTSFLLFGSDNLYFIITAAVAAGLLVVPLLLALGAYLRTGTFLPSRGVLNGDLPGPKHVPEEDPRPAEGAALAGAVPRLEGEVRPLPPGLKIAALAILLAGLASTRLATPVGDFLAYPVATDQAERAFADSLRSRGWADPDTLRLRAFAPSPQRSEPQAAAPVYLLKQLRSVAALNARYDTLHQYGQWSLRAYKPQNRAYYRGGVHGKTGRVHSLGLYLPEAAGGDSLADDAARERVLAAFARAGVDTSLLVEVEHSQQVRPHRLDHYFTFEAKEGDPRHLAESRLRWSAQVIGGHIAVQPDPFTKLPEEWVREREAETGLNTAFRIVRLAAFALLLGYVVVFFVLRVRKGQVPLRRSFLLAVVPGVLGVASLPAMISALERSYLQVLELEWMVFLLVGSVGFVLVYGFQYLLIAFGLAVLGTMYPDSSTQLGPAPRRNGWLGALLALGAGVGGALLASGLATLLANLWPTGLAAVSWPIPDTLGASFPSGDMLFTWIGRSMIALLALGVVAHLWNGPLGSTGGRALIALALLLMLSSPDVATLEEFLFSLARAAVLLIAVYLVMVVAVRGSALRLLAAVSGGIWVRVTAPAFASGNAALAGHAWGFTALLLVVWVVWLLARRGGREVARS